MTKAMKDLQELLLRLKEEGMNIYLFFCISKILLWILAGYVFIVLFVVEEDFPFQAFRITRKETPTRETSSLRLIIMLKHLSYFVGSTLLYLLTPDFEHLMSSMVFEEE